MLNLTPSEERTIFIIAGVLILAGLFYIIGPYQSKVIAIDYSESDSIFSRLSHRSIPTQKTDKEINHQTKIINPKKTLNAEKGSIDINVANEIDLIKLPRIGPAMAKRIIEYRTINGPFNSVNDLRKVRGIGKKTIKLIRPYLRNIE